MSQDIRLDDRVAVQQQNVLRFGMVQQLVQRQIVSAGEAKILG